MNYFNRNRTVILVLSLLLIVALSGLATMAWHNYKQTPTQHPGATCSNSIMFLEAELRLTPDQVSRIEKIKSDCMGSSRCIVRELKDKKQELVTEMSSANPDSTRLNLLAAEIGRQQEQVIQTTIHQYLRIKAVCTPAQKEKLSGLYFELMGCGNAEMKNGKGRQHQHGKSEMNSACPAQCSGK